MKVDSIVFMRNGTVVVWDEKYNQVPELQGSWLINYIEYMKSKGAEIDYNNTEILMPNSAKAKIFEIDGITNYSIEIM